MIVVADCAFIVDCCCCCGSVLLIAVLMFVVVVVVGVAFCLLFVAVFVAC